MQITVIHNQGFSSPAQETCTCLLIRFKVEAKTKTWNLDFHPDVKISNQVGSFILCKASDVFALYKIAVKSYTITTQTCMPKTREKLKSISLFGCLPSIGLSVIPERLNLKKKGFIILISYEYPFHDEKKIIRKLNTLYVVETVVGCVVVV